MKKFWVLLCAGALLCACAAPASAAGLREKLNDMMSLIQEEAAPTAPGDPGGGAPSLWGKRVRLEKTAVPDEAFRDGGEVCTAVSPTGTRLLICGGPEPCLWDTETPERIPLFLGDAESKAVIREYLERLATEGKMKLTGPMEDGALFSAYIASAQAARRQYAPRFVPDYPGSGRSAYLRVAETASGAVFLLNTETGALYIADNGIYVAELNGMLLRQDPAGSGTVSLKDVKTGRITTIDFARLAGLEGRASVTAAQFLPDGSICAVLRSGKVDPKKGEACAAVVRSPSGTVQRYALGMIRLGREPDRIFCAGADQIVLYSRNALQQLRPYRIDRAKGSVSLLTCENNRVQAVSLESRLDAAQQIAQPEGPSMIVYGPCADGETLLVHSFDGTLLLYRPSTMETSPLLALGEAYGLMDFSYFSWNGADRMAGKPERAYYQLKAE